MAAVALSIYQMVDSVAVIPEALAGQRIAVTGATGFLGTALVERLLRRFPTHELVLLVRPGRRSSVAQRAKREIFRNDAFDRLRHELGDGFDAEMASRIEVVAGDVASDGLGLDEAGRAPVSGCDIVIHSAATCQLRLPLDSAVEVNLLGPSRIRRAPRVGVRPTWSRSRPATSPATAGAGARGLSRRQPVLRRRSTGGRGRGRPPRSGRPRSRQPTPGSSPASGKEAATSSARPGRLLAAKTEQLRRLGQGPDGGSRHRARVLGWPDVYAYTKALGERACCSSSADVPVTIVRPSIIESAWAEPVRAGSRASGWPSRSSSPTPGAC